MVTSYDDALTQAVCAARRDLRADRSPPRRRRGLQQGPAGQPRPGPSAAPRLDRDLDADIALPDRLRWVLGKSRLDADCIYGADRLEVVGRGAWRRLQDDPRPSSGSIATSTSSAGRRCPWARGFCTTSTATARSGISSFGTRSMPRGGITTAKARPSTATCSSPCNGPRGSGCSCPSCSSTTCNRSLPRSARTGKGGGRGGGEKRRVGQDRFKRSQAHR